MIDFEKYKEEEGFAAQEAAIKLGTTLATTDPFDLSKVKKDFAPYLEKLDEMEKIARAFSIVTSEDAGRAVEMAGQVKNLGKEMDTERKMAIEKPGQFVSSVNKFVKIFSEKVTTIETILKKKIGDHSYKIETERREAEAKAQAEAKKLQEKINKAAEKKGTVPVQVVIPVTVEKPSVIRSETGASSSIRKKWKARITDPDKVDRVFCSPDPHKLQDAVNTGLREIAGCEVFEEITTVLRS